MSRTRFRWRAQCTRRSTLLSPCRQQMVLPRIAGARRLSPRRLRGTIAYSGRVTTTRLKSSAFGYGNTPRPVAGTTRPIQPRVNQPNAGNAFAGYGRGSTTLQQSARGAAVAGGAIEPAVAGIAIAWRMPARASAYGTACCGAPTRSGSASAAMPAWRRPSRQTRRACGGTAARASLPGARGDSSDQTWRKR